MAAQDFDTDQFERRLITLKDSQDSIQGLSAWCLERRSHHKKIVATWLQVLKKVKVDHRLTLFYLANDVIQYSKRKNFEFVESWGTTLQRATTMVRDEKVKHRILRIFKIWDQRGVYDEEFLADLSGLISAAPKKKPEAQVVQQPEEFQAPILVSTMRSCATLEQATDARLRDLRHCNLNIDNAEELCSSLKDRRRVEDAEKQVDIAAKSIENYVKALEAEIRERKQVLDLLDQAEAFYETQRGEVKIVVNAYRNFGSRVKNLKKKLDELVPMLQSPLPSPDINAPSPSPDSDIELPDDMSQSIVPPPSLYGSYSQGYNPALALSQSGLSENSSFTNNFSSFMGGNVDFDMRNVFSDNSNVSNPKTQSFDTTGQTPLKVINTDSPAVEVTSPAPPNFLKTVTPTEPACSIPGLGDASDVPVLPTPDYVPSVLGLNVISPLTPTLNMPGTPISNVNDNLINHSTPLVSRALTNDSHLSSPYSSQNSQSNLTPFDQPANSNIVSPLPPPPLPPSLFLEDEPCYNKLPPKFPTWTFANEPSSEPVKSWDQTEYPKQTDINSAWPGSDLSNDQWDGSNEATWPSMRTKNLLSETPESPPLYEKAGFHQPVEYNDSQMQEPLLSSVGDVDHRVINIPVSVDKQLSHRLMKGADVDHRNLISLTGSPANNNSNDNPASGSNDKLWTNIDQDYRRQNVQPGDNVESIDMELSDDENENKKNRLLVDVRPQDRDMRGPIPPSMQSHHHPADMDMRMIPPNKHAMNTPHNMGPAPQVLDTRPPPPPPPLPPFLQNAFNQGFHDNDDYGINQDFTQDRDFDFYDSANSNMSSFSNVPPIRERNLGNMNKPIILEQDTSNNQPVLSTDMVILNDSGKSFPAPPPMEKSPPPCDENFEVSEPVRVSESITVNSTCSNSTITTITNTIGNSQMKSNFVSTHPASKSDSWLKQSVEPIKQQQLHKLNNLVTSGAFTKDNRKLINKVNNKQTAQKSENTSQQNGPAAMTPADHLRASMIAEYESQQLSLRNQSQAPPQNPYSWRGNNAQRGRGSNFRGAPRLPWLDRPPRSMMVGSYNSRGMKSRGHSYRGSSSFRGRGRGNVW